MDVIEGRNENILTHDEVALLSHLHDETTILAEEGGEVAGRLIGRGLADVIVDADEVDRVLVLTDRGRRVAARFR